jgi:hypothetical protein
MSLKREEIVIFRTIFLTLLVDVSIYQLYQINHILYYCELEFAQRMAVQRLADRCPVSILPGISETHY